MSNSVCSLTGFKLSNSWETYVRELHKDQPLSYLSGTRKFGERTQMKQLKIAFFMPLITVQMVSNPMILVTWKFMKMTTLKKLQTLTKWKCSVLKKCKCDLKLDYLLGSVLTYCNVRAKNNLILKVLKYLKLLDVFDYVRNQPSYSVNTEGSLMMTFLNRQRVGF